jgi:hypothetical protein
MASRAKAPELKEQKVYTESQFERINNAVCKLQAVLQHKALLEAQEIGLRAEILELTASAVAPDDKMVLPGFTVEERVSYEIDPEQVMDWIFSDEANMYSAGPLVTVGSDLTAMILGRAIENPSFRSLLVPYTAGVNKAIEKGTHKGLPHGQKFVTQTLKVSPLNIKTGSELRAALCIIPDDGEDTPQPVEQSA